MSLSSRAQAPLWTTLLLLASTALVLWRERGPTPQPLTSPLTHFSADRAAATFDALPGASVPHPVGSPAHTAMGAAIVDRLRELGLASERDHALHARQRDPEGSDLAPIVVPVRNITALLEGTGPRDAPLFVLSTHYDSVPAGPGASDAGLGCAALLECARALVERAAQGERLAHDVLFLFADGEEADLTGAARFLAHDPRAARVGCVLNLEARGTTGLVRLFRTSGPQAELVEFLARAAPHPSTTSFAAVVFELLPNDTDVSVYAAAGLAAIDAANIGGVVRYHTALDDASHRSLRSLQHHGDTALALASAWHGEGAPSANADDKQTRHDPRWWSDVLGLRVVHAPEWSAAVLALLLLALTLYAARKALAHALSTSARVLLGCGAAALLSSVLVKGLLWLHKDGAQPDPAPWSAHTWPWTLGLACVCMAVGASITSGWTKRAGQRCGVHGVLLAWCGLTVGVALWRGGAAAPLLVPLLVLVPWALWSARTARVVAAPVALLCVMPLLLGIVESFGHALPVALAVPWALVGALLGPVWSSLPRWLFGTGAVVGLAAAAWLPARDADAPRTDPAQRGWGPALRNPLPPATSSDGLVWELPLPHGATVFHVPLQGAAQLVSIETGDLVWTPMPTQALYVRVMGEFQEPIRLRYSRPLTELSLGRP